MSNKTVIHSSHENRKQFNYQKGAVTLAFNLNMDNKTELRDFLELLVKGAVELGEHIKNKPTK